MTKREKVLLQILVCVIIVGVTTVYLLLPQIKRYITLSKQYDEDSEQITMMKTILETPNIEESMDKANEKADNYYSFFNGSVNSFNIDELINGLVSKNNLDISALSIEEYKEVNDSALIKEEETEEFTDDFYFSDEDYVEEEEIPKDKILMVCTVSFRVKGRYEDVMSMVDELNASSECVVITSFTCERDYSYLGTDEENADEYVSVGIEFEMYGLKKYEPQEVDTDSLDIEDSESEVPNNG